MKDPESGGTEEKVYDVAWPDEREIDRSPGRLPAVGNTVVIKTANYEYSIGDTMLSTVWRDPDFDPSIKAAYYARVLEKPAPRGSTYDAPRGSA
jgi:hypothetical protein